jgi:glutathione peroxidase
MTDATAPSVYDFSALSVDGHELPLAQYKGQVLVIVNTASKCGFTPQYAGLEALYKEYKDRGVVVLGFPCNQFGAQEPGTETEIAQFCELNYGVSFPIFSKIDVNGANAHPLYKFLKGEKPGILGAIGMDSIKWNFTKFLVDRAGNVVGRYAPSTTPAELAPEIDKLLAD